MTFLSSQDDSPDRSPRLSLAHSIGATLDSILAQTMPDLEVICVNGSTGNI